MRRKFFVAFFIFILLCYYLALNAQQEVSIYDIQYTTDSGSGTYPSPYDGQTVTITGIVTASNYYSSGSSLRFFISEPEGGAWNGVYIFQNTYEVEVGDEVTLTGEVDEYYGVTQITNLSSFSINSNGNPVPDALPASTGDLQSPATAEQYEGCLVQVQNVETVETPNNYGEWYVDDGSGECQIDDGIFTYDDPSIGEEFASITGALDYSYDEYAINPREQSDFVAAGNDTIPPTLFSASVLTPNEVELVYSESVNDITAENVENYEISDLNIVDIELQSDCKTVHISTTIQTEGENYTITVNNVEDLAGNIIEPNSQIEYISIGDISADFIANTTSGIIPLTINFTDQSTALYSIENWKWDFDNDGNIDSNQQNPSHTYCEEGIYSVKLIVSTSALSDTIIRNNYITAIYGVAIDGDVHLNNSINHEGIEIELERIAPTSLNYSTITNEDGYYETKVETGIYEITFSKAGYYSYTLEGVILYSNTTIQDVTIYTYIPIPLYYSSIQEGINHCLDSDTVLVDTGTYVENIDFNGRNIIVSSKFAATGDTSYISQTIIDGNHSGNVVRFDSWENSNTLLNGFTLKNGDAYDGGGIYCEDSNPTLKHLIIDSNTASDDGGGIFCDNSDPSLTNLTIANNVAGDDGAGIYCYNGSNPTLKNTIVSNNICNYGIYVSSGTPSIMYCNFYDNDNGNFYGCGDWVGVNVTTNVNGDSCDAYFNIQEDPLFTDTANGDYHLIEDSPCIDAGDPTSPLDPDGTRADIGAFYFNQGVAVDDEPQTIPENSFVGYPNPVTAKTNKVSISFALKKPSKVNIKLFNIKGQLVGEILNNYKQSGTHTITSSTNNLSSGIYFIKMDIGGKNRAIKKMVKIE